jgi:mannose-binding lectin 2
MWLTKQRATQGPVFGSTDRFEGLGIFVDTYKNNRPGVSFPYVMAMMGDGQTTYDQAHDGKANELAGCSVRSLTILPLWDSHLIFSRPVVSAALLSLPSCA